MNRVSEVIIKATRIETGLHHPIWYGSKREAKRRLKLLTAALEQDYNNFEIVDNDKREVLR